MSGFEPLIAHSSPVTTYAKSYDPFSGHGTETWHENPAGGIECPAPRSRAVATCKDQLQESERELELARGQLRDYEDRVGQPFTHESYMRQLADLRDRLKLALSNHPLDGETAAELSDKTG